jgi:hypothetical protein
LTELARYASRSLAFGPLQTTLHPSAVPEGGCAVKHNASTRRGVVELDDRYRKVTTPSNESPVGLAVWERGVEGSHIFYIRKLSSSGKYYLVRADASVLASSGGSGTTVSNVVSFDGGAPCCIWQLGDRLHIVDGGGMLWYVDPAYTVRPQYRDYAANTSDGVVSVSKPPYDGYTTGIDTSVDTVTSLVAEKVTPGVFTSAGGVLSNTFSATHSGNPGWWTIEVAFGTVKDWTGVEAIYIPYVSGASGKRTRIEPQASNAIIEVEDSVGTKKRVPVTASRGVQLDQVGGGKANHVSYSIKDLGSVNRSAIKKVRFYFRLAVWSETNLLLQVGPIYLGGAYLSRVDAGQRLYDAALSRQSAQFAYRYRRSTANPGTNPADATGTLGWFETTLDSGDVLGEALGNTFPIGAWAKVAPPTDDPDTFPYGTGAGQYDRIDVCRRVKDGAARRWVRITGTSELVNRANASDVNSVVHNLDEVQVLATLAPDKDYGTGDAPTGASGYDPSVSGQVGGLTCGASWLGACVYASKDGKVYFSSQQDFKTVAWTGVNIGPVDVADVGNPRTVDLGVSTSTPVLALVGTESLYAFTSQECFVFVGTIPSLADGPYIMPSSRGALGHRAAVAALGGVVAGCDEGLFFYKVPGAYQGGAEGVVVDELTKDVRTTWAWLLGSARSELVVASTPTTVFCFCQDRYMRLDSGHGWSSGAWADGAFVHMAVSHRRYGIGLAVTSNGSADMALATLGRYTTDGGTNLAGSNGTVATYEVATGFAFGDINVKAVRLHQPDGYSGHGTVRVVHDLGADQSGTITSDAPMIRFKPPLGGRWVQFHLTGRAGDIISDVEVEVSGRSDRRSQH